MLRTSVSHRRVLRACPEPVEGPAQATMPTPLTMWGIFHYIYAVLHHPDYRQRYAANLRRELPASPLSVSPLLCHPERSRMIRERIILRSRGTCFSQTPPPPKSHPSRAASRNKKRKPIPLCWRPLLESAARRPLPTPTTAANRSSPLRRTNAPGIANDPNRR